MPPLDPAGDSVPLWRSLRLARAPEEEQFVRDEFPGEQHFRGEMSRRHFLGLLAAGVGMSALNACRKPIERIYPYNDQPENMVLGEPLFFATTLELRGYGRGAVVESHTGRPTKVEGNPRHPDSLGATDVFMQAAILGLYDADRSQAVKRSGEIATWDAFLADWRAGLAEAGAGGEGVRILTPTVTSPTLARLLRRFREKYPRAVWHRYEPVNRDAAREGARAAFGRVLDTRYRLDRADVVLALDADFLATVPGGLRYARDFGARRKPESGGLIRLYAAEPTPSKTGAVADHRLELRAAEVGPFAAWLAKACGASVAGDARLPDSVPRRWAEAVAADLRRARGRALVIPGDWQPAAVHALAHAANHALGADGRAVEHAEPAEAEPVVHHESLRELVEAMRAGAVSQLLLVDGNPVYDAPADLDFGGALRRVPRSAHLSLYDDETSELCRWHVPAAHPLERWSDSRAYDGTSSIVQPLIEPLYGGKTALDVLAASLEATPPSAHDLVRETWKAHGGRGDFDGFWRESLNQGIVAGTATAPAAASVRTALPAPPPPPSGAIEVVFRPDPSVDDGAWANNAWLQELPKPLTRLTWDNAALISPALAGRLGLQDGDVAEFRLGGRTVRGPVLALPGQAQDSVTLALGYGRRRSGRWAMRAGFDVYPLRTLAEPWHASGIAVSRTSSRHAFASVQEQHRMADREPAKEATLARYQSEPGFAHAEKEPGPEDTLLGPVKRGEHAWGMAIDLGSCIGCNACVIACQAENNIAVVGREEVARGRIMQWIRVDGYFAGSTDAPGFRFQPVPCMHCENAPCEPVCPVGATVHDDEGLNEMVYNRCVGTRYCSNNCPYKVRRFNFFWYSDYDDPARKLGYNPNVTVRARGVMEKCTYCVQRIKRAEIRSEVDDKPLKDGDVVTACQSACPAEAIVFGDISDPNSKVSRLKAQARNYGLLSELGTRPRTTYLARITNPNEDLG